MKDSSRNIMKEIYLIKTYVVAKAEMRLSPEPQAKAWGNYRSAKINYRIKIIKTALQYSLESA